MSKSYLKFNKSQLINLNYSLNKELLRTSRNGGYSSSTIIGCNTRKYHGLLVVPQPGVDGGRHVLLSNVDETLFINDSEFHLSSRIFPNGYIHPKGHKYIRDFNSDPHLNLSYRIGRTIFNKEYIFVENESRLLLKYTLEDSAAEKVLFRISPLLAYRSIHTITKSNLDINSKYEAIDNGSSWQLYPGYSKLYFQVSKEADYVHTPDWHYNIEYPMERDRGFEHNEDLFVPGFFDMELEKGESIVISVGLEEKTPSGFKRTFTNEVKKRHVRNNYENCLKNAADQFLIKRYGRYEVIAGYHWYGRWGRDSFISLPGICLVDDNEKEFHQVMKSMIKELKDGNFPNVCSKEVLNYDAADTPFWFFRSLHKLHQMTKGKSDVWKLYGKTVKSILKAWADEENNIISITENGLIWAEGSNSPISWMDASNDFGPVTERTGFLVEINALWYDAICFFLEQAKKQKDQAFVNKWKDFPDRIRESFNKLFWNEKKAYLADFVDEGGPDWDIRPNMLFAVSERFSPLSAYQKEYVLKIIHDELLTPRGLRSLSPKNNKYKGKYEGSEQQRNMAYHQGSVWPWLLGAFAESYLKLHKKTGKDFVKKIYLNFEKEMHVGGIGTISELYDGNPPFDAKGSVSQAWSVAELLRIKWMMDNKDHLE